jgi:hypothetical protein
MYPKTSAIILRMFKRVQNPVHLLLICLQTFSPNVLAFSYIIFVLFFLVYYFRDC